MYNLKCYYDDINKYLFNRLVMNSLSVQFNHLGMNIYPAMSKRSKELPNCMEIAEQIVVLIIFHGVLYHVRAYNITVALHASGTWKPIF